MFQYDPIQSAWLYMDLPNLFSARAISNMGAMAWKQRLAMNCLVKKYEKWDSSSKDLPLEVCFLIWKQSMAIRKPNLFKIADATPSQFQSMATSSRKLTSILCKSMVFQNGQLSSWHFCLMVSSMSEHWIVTATHPSCGLSQDDRGFVPIHVVPHQPSCFMFHSWSLIGIDPDVFPWYPHFVLLKP